MSIVNSKMIFVKKQKETLNLVPWGRGWETLAVFILETDFPSEKIGEEISVGEGATVHRLVQTDNPFLALVENGQ